MTSTHPDPRNGLRCFLLLDALIRSAIWSAAAALTTWLVVRFHIWPESLEGSMSIGSLLGAVSAGTVWILLFNVGYVLVLLVARLPIPMPKEGRYTLAPGQPLPLSVVSSCILAILTKARYDAPFPGFLVFNLANLPPLVWLMGPIFGPRSRSCYVVDPNVLDPHMVEIGRNVTIGYRAILAAHSQERDAIIYRKTVIEDDVLLGGDCKVYGGCTIKRGAVVLAGAVVTPGTVIGENELWGGMPAKKIKDLPAYGAESSVAKST